MLGDEGADATVMRSTPEGTLAALDQVAPLSELYQICPVAAFAKLASRLSTRLVPPVDASDSDVDLNGISPLVTIDATTVNTDIDAGVIYRSTIGGRLWYDLDRDGAQDAGEPGIANVDVQLRDSANAVIATARSDARGNYAFNGFAPGAYSVDVVNAQLPAGLSLHPSLFDPRTGVTLGAGQSSAAVDFGYVNAAATATGAVWRRSAGG